MRFVAIVFSLFIALSYSVETWAADDTQAADSADNDMDFNDPWEPVNRPIFDFNVALDRYFFNPVIVVYDVIPHEVRHNVDNFLNNLGEPLNVVEGVLQLDPKITFTSLWRFILNSTFGLGGMRDFAKEQAGLPGTHQNLGSTLGVWGVPSGPYVVLPVMGPSSIRDTTGKVGDVFLDPVEWELTTYASIGKGVADGIDARDVHAKIIENLYYQSLDPYAATRSAYRQNEAYRDSSHIQNSKH